MFQLGAWDKDTKNSDHIIKEMFKNRELNSSIDYNKAKLKKKKLKDKRQLRKKAKLSVDNQESKIYRNMNNKTVGNKESANKKRIIKSSNSNLDKKQIATPNTSSKITKKAKWKKKSESNETAISVNSKNKSLKNYDNAVIKNNSPIRPILHKKKNTKKSRLKKSKQNETVKQANNKQNQDVIESQPEHLDYRQKKKQKLKEKIKNVFKETSTTLVETKNPKKILTLREKMIRKLKSARFRYINEEIYSNDSKEAQKIFQSDPDAFEAYHVGYRQQVDIWPLNPVDVIINGIKKLPKTFKIADFGCGEAKLSQSVEQEVHSFDLVAINQFVTACDMAHVPLQSNSIDVVVFCLSLMGTNLHDYLLEANRVLKIGGILKIAEIESRFDDINIFIEGLKQFKFKNTWQDLSHNLFYFLDFKKEQNIKKKSKLPTISLHPCLYKKR